MKKQFILSLAVAFLATNSNASYNKSLDTKIQTIVNQDKTKLVKTFKDIHTHPELGFMETRTSKIVATTLKQLGYQVHTNIGKTGVVAVMKNGKGPVVLYRADMDALPVKEITNLPYASKKNVKLSDGTITPVMHACGHDAHTTWLLGVAKVMAKLKDKWHGTLILVAQPAEELIEGGSKMAKDRLYDIISVPDYAFAMHTAPLPTGMINMEKGLREAGTDQLDVTFYGKGGHGSTPQLAKDPILMAASAIVQYQFIVSRTIDTLHPVVLTVGAINSGKSNNVIPAKAELKINLRWDYKEDREHMIKAIKRINNSIALAYDMPKERYPTIKMKGYSIPLVNDDALVDKITPIAQKVLGQKAVIKGMPQTMGSEDFQMLFENKKTKYVYAFFGTAKPSDFEKSFKEDKTVPYMTHNGNYKVDLDAIPLGVRFASNALLEIFSNK